MEKRIGVWKNNLSNGIILGLVGIVYTLVIYFLDLTFNRIQGFVFILIQVVIVYYLLKSYRNNYMNGMITYGQSLGAGVVIFLYYSIIAAIFTYILYTVIDPGMIEKLIAFTEEKMIRKGIPQNRIDAGMAVQAKLMKPGIMAMMSIINTMILGLIISLIVSIFIKKDGNPLADSSSDN